MSDWRKEIEELSKGYSNKLRWAAEVYALENPYRIRCWASSREKAILSTVKAFKKEFPKEKQAPLICIVEPSLDIVISPTRQGRISSLTCQ